MIFKKKISKVQDFSRQRTLSHSVKWQCIPKEKKCIQALKRRICTVKGLATIYNRVLSGNVSLAVVTWMVTVH